MAANVFEEEQEVISEINVVPFVDIVLVLLITFMLTSSVIARASISVDLPTAKSGGDAVQSTLNIVIERDGKLFLNGAATTAEHLRAYTARAAWREQDLQAVISADRGVNYGAVVSVIDLVKTGGIKTFALNIQRDL